MRNWLRQNRRAFVSAVRKLASRQSGGFVSALVIGIALSLPTAGYVMLESLRALGGRLSFDPQISLFLAPSASPRDAEALRARLRADPRISEVTLVGRDEALRQMQAADGLAEVVKALGRNPLPDMLIVHPGQKDFNAVDALARDLRRTQGVDQVQADTLWARRLAALGELLRLALALITVLLGLGLVSVTFNTVRLQILTQREEIAVAKLLGASDGFVRRPFLYLGVLQGVAGGVLAVAVSAITVSALNFKVDALAQSYGSNFRFGSLPTLDALVVLVFSALLGWIGSFMSVSKHLREID